MKKQTRLTASLFVIIALLAIMALLPQRIAEAACGLAVPCTPVPSKQAKQKNAAHTKVPPTDTAMPTATATDTAEPTATEPAPSATSAPVSANSALVSTPSCGSPAPAPSPSPTPAPGGGFGSLLPWFMGGGGLILGLGVGFFTGGVRGKTNVNGDGIVGPDRGWTGPITTPAELQPSMDKWDKWNKYDKWDKFDKWQKGAPGEDLGNAMDKWQKADTGQVDAGALDMFHKGQDAGYTGDGNKAGMADGSVRPAEFGNKLGGSEAGMGDGSVRPTDFIKKIGDTPGSNITGNFDR